MMLHSIAVKATALSISIITATTAITPSVSLASGWFDWGHHHRSSGDVIAGVLVGGIIGAAIGSYNARGQAKKDADKQRSAPPPDPNSKSEQMRQANERAEAENAEIRKQNDEIRRAQELQKERDRLRKQNEQLRREAEQQAKGEN